MEHKITAPHMTSIERELYEAGHEEEYRGFVIQPKRDFGTSGYWSSEHRCNINAGWVALNGGGRYAGFLATPGAVWAWTLKGAREMVDDMISAGFTGRSDEVGGGGNGDEFHRLCRERHLREREAA